MSAVSGDNGRLLVPRFLRTPSLFMDANSVMADVLTVLEEAKPALERSGTVGVDLVLLTRRELTVVDASWPIDLPMWYAVAGARGATVTTTVQESTWEVAASLGDPALPLEDISRLLYDLDEAMLSRFRVALASSKRKVQSIEAVLFGESDWLRNWNASKRHCARRAFRNRTSGLARGQVETTRSRRRSGVWSTTPVLRGWRNVRKHSLESWDPSLRRKTSLYGRRSSRC